MRRSHEAPLQSERTRAKARAITAFRLAWSQPSLLTLGAPKKDERLFKNFGKGHWSNAGVPDNRARVSGGQQRDGRARRADCMGRNAAGFRDAAIYADPV